MKKTLRKNGRHLLTLILTISMMLSMVTNVFAGWETYNSGTVYLEETWVGSKQCINFYSGGQWKRNVAGEGNTLWINSIPVLNNLYSTGYWCFDKYGNTWVINTSQQLLLCKADTTSFVVNNSITGCTGFQRDSGKVGYLVYTNNGTYSLDDLLNGRNITYNSGGSYTTNVVSKVDPYPYVQKLGYCYYYHISSSKSYTYYLNDLDLYYLGTNDKDSNVYMATGIQNMAFTTNGYVILANKDGSVYSYPIGKTTKTYRKSIGNSFSYFYEENNMCYGYYNMNGEYKEFSNLGSDYSNNYSYNYSYDYTDYPYVKKTNSYYYYYTSANKYYKYYLSGSTLYYKGTNSSSSNTKLATSVDEVTFWPNGYIVYATTNNYVYAYSLGKTTSSYKITIGKYFDHFDEYYEDYMSMGYYNTSGNYREFSVYDNDDDYRYSEDYPYVQKSGSYYYYYTSSSKYYKYYLSGSTLYYKGTNSSSSNTKLATSVDEITFSPDGYIVYSVNDSYDRVYAYPVGKTSSSYKETVGKYFDCFDEDYGDYMSSGYYDRYDDFIDFDF